MIRNSLKLVQKGFSHPLSSDVNLRKKSNIPCSYKASSGIHACLNTTFLFADRFSAKSISF